MRIIDVNPIYDKVEANYRMSEGVQHECEREFLNLICDAPTVDAVPIDFIKALHADYVQRSKALQGRIGYMYTLYAIALENLVQNWDSDSKISDEMICERVSMDGE